MGDKQTFLQRERSALTRRRQIFGEKLPNKMVYLTPKSNRRSDNFVAQVILNKIDALCQWSCNKIFL